MNGQTVNTQVVSADLAGGKMNLSDLKRTALKSALQSRAITIGQSLQASFRVFDATGNQVPEPAEVEWKAE